MCRSRHAGCLGGGMHPMSWHQKRAHLSAMAQGRAMFGRVKDMTPARFDILYWIYRHRRTKSVTDVLGFRIAQATLTRALGLARQTVWKMVKRLTELGLVTVTKDLCDRRRNVVKLTEEGIKRIRLGMGAAFSEVPPLPNDAPCYRTTRPASSTGPCPATGGDRSSPTSCSPTRATSFRPRSDAR